MTVTITKARNQFDKNSTRYSLEISCILPLSSEGYKRVMDAVEEIGQVLDPIIDRENDEKRTRMTGMQKKEGKKE